MESFVLRELLPAVNNFGIPGLLLVFLFLTTHIQEKNLKIYRDDTTKILQAYQKDMNEVRLMYERNVNLVRSYEDLAQDLKEVVTLNTRVMTQLCDDVRNNQFCPAVRLKKSQIDAFIGT